jgi:hypothetical protein
MIESVSFRLEPKAPHVLNIYNIKKHISFDIDGGDEVELPDKDIEKLIDLLQEWIKGKDRSKQGGVKS